MGATCDLSDAEGHAGQRHTVCAGLDNLQRRLDRVGKDELTGLIGEEMDDALGVVDLIAGQFFSVTA